MISYSTENQNFCLFWEIDKVCYILFDAADGMFPLLSTEANSLAAVSMFP